MLEQHDRFKLSTYCMPRHSTTVWNQSDKFIKVSRYSLFYLNLICTSQEEATARNRVLASAMLNANANSVASQKQKFIPATNYSPPTCHTALQAVKNRQFQLKHDQSLEQQQVQQMQPVVKFEIGSGLVRPPEPQLPSYHYGGGHKFTPNAANNSYVTGLSQHFDKSSNNNNNNNNDDDETDESNRKLARTWSVGKLVNNFETSPSSPQEFSSTAQSNPVRDLRNPGAPTTVLYHKFSAPSLPPGFQVSNGTAKPFVAPKPPSLMGAGGNNKPLLRHTVSLIPDAREGQASS